MLSKVNLVKNAVFCGLFLAASGSFAADDFTTCPSAASLKETFSIEGKTFDADLTYTSPLSFDLPTNTVKMSVFKKNWIESGSLNFIMSNLTVPAGEDAEAIAYALIETLQADYTAPVPFRVDDDLSISLCAYTSSNNSDVKALVFYGTDKPE